jgi:hypothetical protein
MTNERWLKWAIARHYRSLNYKVSMKPARAGNAIVDGVAVGPEGERIAIEVKSPSDDIIRESDSATRQFALDTIGRFLSRPCELQRDYESAHSSGETSDWSVLMPRLEYTGTTPTAGDF